MDPAPSSRAEAQRRADRLRVLLSELESLERQSVLALSDDQRAALQTHIDRTLRDYAARFDIDTTEVEKKVSWGLRIVSTLGGIAFCAALFLFFRRFWGYLSTPVQIIVTMLLVFAALGATEFAARRERTLYFAALLSLATLAAFILNLSVIGIVFNITATPNAMLAWGLFAMLLAYRHGLRIQLIAGLLLLLSWWSATVTDRFGIPWDEFFDRPEHFAMAGLALFFLPFAARHAKMPDFPPVYRIVGCCVVLVSLLAVSEGAYTYLPWSREAVKLSYGWLAMLVSAGGVVLGIRRDWTGVVGVSSGFFALFLFLRLFHWLWDLMPGYVFFAIIGGIAIALVVLFKHIRTRMVSA